MKPPLFVATFLALGCQITNARIYRLVRTHTEQIRALDQQKTVVILSWWPSC